MQLHAGGAGEHVLGVNRAGGIFQRAGDPHGAWTKLGGALTHVSVSADGQHIWGVNAGDQVYRRDVANAKWERVPGALTQVCVSACGGHVLGVNRGGAIYHRQRKDSAWTKLSGSLTHVSASTGARHIWGVNAAGQIYYRRGVEAAKWERVPGALTQVCVSACGRHVLIVLYMLLAVSTLSESFSLISGVQLISAAAMCYIAHCHCIPLALCHCHNAPLLHLAAHEEHPPAHARRHAGQGQGRRLQGPPSPLRVSLTAARTLNAVGPPRATLLLR